MMHRQRCWLIAVSVAVLFLVGCGQSADLPEDVVAEVNGEVITAGDIEQAALEARQNFELYSRISEYTGPFPDEQRDAYRQWVREMGYDPEQLSEDQHRYFQTCFASERRADPSRVPTNDEKRHMQRQLRFAVLGQDDNLVFNDLVRKAVLYGEAVECGYTVTLDDVRRMLQETDTEWKAFIKRSGEREKYLEYLEIEKQVYGYRSRDEWLESRLPRIAREMSISRLQQRFGEVFGADNPGIQGADFWLASGNAWEDYTEYLLRQAELKILNKDYQLEYYGEPWSGGRLDLAELEQAEDADRPKIHQQAVLLPEVEWTETEMNRILRVLRQRLEALGASEITITEGEVILLGASWHEMIPWNVLGRQGVLQIGDGAEVIGNRHVVKVTFDKQMSANVPQLSLLVDLNEEGAALLERLTAANIGKPIPILIDGELVANPTVHEPITDGRFRITSVEMNEAELRALAAVLSTETLPQHVTISIGP